MIWFIIGHRFTSLLARVRISRLSEQEKDLERLLLRQQMVMMERHLDKSVRPSHGTQSDHGRLFVQRMLTVAETCRLRPRPAFAFVHAALVAYRASIRLWCKTNGKKTTGAGESGDLRA